MKEKLDVFEILGAGHKESETMDQEHEYVPDSDFSEVLRQLKTPEERLDMKQLLGKRKEAEDPSVEKKTVYEKSAERMHAAKKTIDELLADEGDPAELTDKQRKIQQTEKSLIKILSKWLVAIAVVLLIFTFVINAPKVVGTSMLPNMQSGDRLIVNLMARNFEVGDVIVFDTVKGSSLVKRIVAAEGDTVDISADGRLIVNGETVEEDYIYTKTFKTDTGVNYPVIIDEGEYFVLGDNRENSRDSRNLDIGLVKKENIKGKVVYSFRKL